MKKMILGQNFEFVNVQGGRYELGWRFDEFLPKETIKYYNSFDDIIDFRSFFFSPRRFSEISNFSISKEAVLWEDVLNDEIEEFDKVETITGFCEVLNLHLNKIGCRLPTEDEFELACGNDFFFWGNEIPDGIPYENRTSFKKHKEANNYGLILDSDTYSSEIVFGYLKLGDGGESVCGGYPWPISWLSLSSVYRIPNVMLSEVLFEMLENAKFRLVLNE